MSAIRRLAMPSTNSSSPGDSAYCARQPGANARQCAELFQAAGGNGGIGTRSHFAERSARAEFEKSARSGFHTPLQASCPLDRLGNLLGQLVQSERDVDDRRAIDPAEEAHAA